MLRHYTGAHRRARGEAAGSVTMSDGQDVLGGEPVADPPALFRLGISGSSFIHVMPEELVATSIIAAQRGTASRFDARQNGMMVEFMREMMHAVNAVLPLNELGEGTSP